MNPGFPPELHGLIRSIEEGVYSRPETVLGSLRELLRRCNGDEQLGYAYQQLGFAHLRLSEHRMARLFYEQALTHQPEDFYSLANLAHAVYELGDKSKGVEYGRRALELKNRAAMAAGPIDIGPPRGEGKNLISFSLYGKKAKYCETALLNCEAAKIHLPGFTCRFYVDGTVPGGITARLRSHSAEIIPVDGMAAGLPGTFWRFLALDDEDADRVLVRDADSLIDAREAHCVNEWIASGKPFHVIRDDCCHTELIQAGLFAARSGAIEKVEEKIARFVSSEENRPLGRYSDQLFLRKCLWPMFREHAVTHDSVYGYGIDARGIPAEVHGAPGARNHFIGANYASYGLKVSAQEPFVEGALHFLRITDDAGQVVCEYEMDRTGPRQLEIFLPLSYARKMEAGAWGSEIYAEAQGTGSRSLVSRLFR